MNAYYEVCRYSGISPSRLTRSVMLLTFIREVTALESHGVIFFSFLSRVENDDIVSEKCINL